MKVSKIVTATALCSLSAIALAQMVRDLSDNDNPRSADDQGNPGATRNNQAGPTAAAKKAIAPPETLAPQKPSATRKQPAAPAKANLLVQKSAPTLPTAPYFQTGSDRPIPVASKIAPPPPPASTETNSRRTAPDLTDPASLSVRDIQGHWAQYYIEYLVSKRVVQGFPDGRFRPNRAITAAEFAVMTQKAFQGKSPISYRDLQARTSNQAGTRAEAAAFVYRSLVQTEPAPIVTSIQVRGAVTRPGDYSMAGYSDPRVQAGSKPTVGRAIQQAGGSLDTANLRQVEVRRTSETGAKQVIKVDVQHILTTGDNAQDVVLQQNDQITIPPIAPTADAGPEVISSQSN